MSFGHISSLYIFSYFSVVIKLIDSFILSTV